MRLLHNIAKVRVFKIFLGLILFVFNLFCFLKFSQSIFMLDNVTMKFHYDKFQIIVVCSYLFTIIAVFLLLIDNILIFDEDNFIIERARTLFWKLSKEILNKYLNGYEVGKYLVIVDDKLFQKSNLNIFSMIDNPILKRHVTLIVTYNCYGYHRNFIFDYRLNN